MSGRPRFSGIAIGAHRSPDRAGDAMEARSREALVRARPRLSIYARRPSRQARPSRGLALPLRIPSLEPGRGSGRLRMSEVHMSVKAGFETTIFTFLAILAAILTLFLVGGCTVPDTPGDLAW